VDGLLSLTPCGKAVRRRAPRKRYSIRENNMLSLWNLHQLMNERRMVQLSDGRVGKVVRVDTTFPANTTTVTVWTDSNEWNGPASGSGPVSGPGISKVALAEIVGEVEKRSA
jgi:hypothetical protein